MDVILDSNVYVSDIKMSGTRFASLFDYLRKMDSALVVPRVVFDEVTARFVERLKSETEVLRKAVETFNWTCSISQASTETPDIKKELEFLQKKLNGQSEKVKTILLDDYSSIDLAEVVRRGVHRIRPASAKGEELRDVIFWLSVLGYARKGQRDIAFISDDRAFADPNKDLFEELRHEIDANKLRIQFFRTVQDFIKANAPSPKLIDASAALRIAPEKKVQGLVEQYVRGQRWTYDVREVVHRDIEFKRGAEYETGPSSKFVELEFLVTMTLETEVAPWLVPGLHNVDAVLSGSGSNLILIEAKTHQSKDEFVVSYRTEKGERIFEVDLRAMLSARIINDQVTTVQVDRVSLEETTDPGFKPLAWAYYL